MKRSSHALILIQHDDLDLDLGKNYGWDRDLEYPTAPQSLSHHHLLHLCLELHRLQLCLLQLRPLKLRPLQLCLLQLCLL
jgi:hypothetical protein